MKLKAFPDLQWLKNQANNRFENRKRWDGTPLPNEGWPNVVLNTKTEFTYRDNINGPLSFFTNISGQSTVTAGGKTMQINQGFFGISNAGEEYTLSIDNPKLTETFNIHFGEHFMLNAYKSLLSPTIETEAPNHPLNFHNRIAPIDAYASQLIGKIRLIHDRDSLQEEELLFEMLSWLIKEDKKVKTATDKLSAVKTSTRKEIMDRLLLSTDYIYAFYNKDLSLEELAQVACLSKFHFLRLFKSTYGKAPHQFINEIRVKHAKQMLTQSSIPVNEIALQCGFFNPSTFSRMFHSQVGMYPSQFREHN